MKNKAYISFFVLVCVLISGLIYVNVFLIHSHGANNVSAQKPPVVQSTFVTTMATKPVELAYQFSIATQALNKQGKVLANSSFQGTIALKQTADKRNWLGQVVDVTLTQQAKTHQFAQALLFKTQYRDYVFSDLNLLGLAKSHPLNAIPYVLAQLSYQTKQPLLIDNATTSIKYRYFIEQNQVTREIHERIDKHSMQGANINDFDDQWVLTLAKDHYPETLHNTVTTSYQNADEEFTLRQSIQMTKSTQLFSWSAHYLANSNATLTFDNKPLNASTAINSKKALQEALLKLASLPDESLAKAIGIYLIEHYSSEEIALLINEQAINSSMASLIIYSVQKNATFAAEVVLIDLLTHPELSFANKQRVVMSLGRFEAVSDLSLNKLKSVAQQADHELASTAQLSIGSLSRYNEEQAFKVNDFLSEQLEKGSDKSVTLLAIHNSGTAELNDQVVKMLGDTSANVNGAVIKVLANDPQYHDKIIDFTIHSKQAKSIKALSKAILANKLVLSADHKAMITKKIQQNTNKAVNDQLRVLLNSKKRQW